MQSIERRIQMLEKDLRRTKLFNLVLAFADTAPYGKGTKTLIDQSVRNSLEIKASKLTYSKPWDATVQAIVQQAATELGLPADRVQKLDRTRRPFALRLTKTLGSHDRSVKRFESDLQLLASLPTGQE